jgi:hypothetical protein
VPTGRDSITAFSIPSVVSSSRAPDGSIEVTEPDAEHHIAIL